MANPTNPNRVVRVKDLDRFKTNGDDHYAQKSELQNLAAEVDVLSSGGDTTTLFGMWVDPTDMHLKGTTVMNGEFSLANGHLLFTTNN